MKIKNMFKKTSKAISTAKVESLDKKQLEKVMGGVEGDGKVVVRGWDTTSK